MTVGGAVGVVGMGVIRDFTSLTRTLSGKRGVIVLPVVSLETVSHGGLWAVGVHVFATVSCAALMVSLGPPVVSLTKAASD